eukprot:TRINITY_DN2677_c0_g1_i1.p1 TRINITY_DN2677_c0_g1~~TRINITY_DN2677_c0_g1_i1.p1  ORF type:complete len:271 (-),score=65.47 TRINITY_DN2677_c0_g1_i1:17-829(-)
MALRLFSAVLGKSLFSQSVARFTAGATLMGCNNNNFGPLPKIIRNIVRFDDEKCDGCAKCVKACHEAAIEIVEGKARLIREILCDGIGDCLKVCPQDAIIVEQRESDPYSEAAVQAHLKQLEIKEKMHKAAELGRTDSDEVPEPELANWPIQLRLNQGSNPVFKDEDLLVAADCSPFTIPDFHSRYLRGRPVVIACPKLDNRQANVDKLADIFANSTPKSITLLRMSVPCCGGLMTAVDEALDVANVNIPVHIHIAGVQGGVSKGNPWMM